jgi:hypothetical protein
MNRWPFLILFFAAVFAVSMLGSLAGTRLFGKSRPAPAARPVGGHLGQTEPWLHKQLNLTEAQKAALQGERERFEAEELRLEREMAEAQDALGHLIRQEKQVTPEMMKYLERINACHGELQRVTLVHLFDTHAQLDELRREVLLDLATTALRDPLTKFNSASASPTTPSGASTP